MRIIFAAILLTAAVPAFGQAPDAAVLAAARDLLIATDFDGQLVASSEKTTTALLKTLLDDVEKKHGEMPAANRAELEALVKRHNSAVVASIQPIALAEAALIYARHFTADELRELQRLQTHPVMAKVNALAPQLFAELSQIGAVESLNALPALEEEIEAMMARWEDEGVLGEKRS